MRIKSKILNNFLKHEQQFWSFQQVVIFTSLVIFFLLLRILPVWGGNFPFQYDNAKDSLIMMDMWSQKDPALVGPTTSIPGLFYGPFWYYLALPFNVIANFHPYAGVAMVLLLGIGNLYLFFRYVNPFTAFLYVTSIGIIGTQQNAWTPYMTSLIMTPLLLLFLRFAKQKKTDVLTVIATAFFISLLFHFQVAYAIVFVPIALVILLRYRNKLGIHQWLIGFATFLVTLVPSLVFELKHDFLQTKSVISFIQNYGEQAHVVQPNQPGLLRLVEIAHYILGNAQQAISPINLGMIAGLIALLIVITHVQTKQHERFVILTIIVGTYLLYLVLPAKSYYLVALSPIWIYAAGRFCSERFFKYLPFLLIGITLLSFIHLRNDFLNYQQLAQNEAFLYAPKAKAVETAYTLSEGKPFASYHFVPEVYDYTYQHIYLTKIRSGSVMPTEFSYAPGEMTYIPYKHIQPTSESPEYIMLIVEKAVYQDVQDDWKKRVMSDLEILDEVQINNAITVYKTRRIDTSSL